MTLLQLAFVASVTAVLAMWCIVRAVTVSAPSISSVYRRLYGNPLALAPPSATSRWERPIASLGRMLAASSAGERLAESRLHQLRVSEVTVGAIATRTITATLVGFIAAIGALGLPMMAGAAHLPWWLAVAAPFGVALLTGYYQYSTILVTMSRRDSAFRAGVAGYIALVSVCLTTRRSAAEAVTYAADIGTGRAFEAIAAAVHAAPQMGLQAWEALDAVGAEYGARELEDLASSIANVSSIGVGVESTVGAVAARMRQVALDDMQRQADRQTASMFGPTMLFVLGTVAFLAYPLSQRVLDAFSTTT